MLIWYNSNQIDDKIDILVNVWNPFSYDCYDFFEVFKIFKYSWATNTCLSISWVTEEPRLGIITWGNLSSKVPWLSDSFISVLIFRVLTTQEYLPLW